MFEHQSYTFDSKAEMAHFAKLGHRLKRFEIEKLKLQPSFLLQDGFTINCDAVKSGKRKMSKMIYTPDFEYFEGGKRVVVEVKGKITTDYRMRLKMFLSRLSHYEVDKFIEVINGKETVYECML